MVQVCRSEIQYDVGGKSTFIITSLIMEERPMLKKLALQGAKITTQIGALSISLSQQVLKPQQWKTMNREYLGADVCNLVGVFLLVETECFGVLTSVFYHLSRSGLTV
jgi:hypothetical protein